MGVINNHNNKCIFLTEENKKFNTSPWRIHMSIKILCVCVYITGIVTIDNMRFICMCRLEVICCNLRAAEKIVLNEFS